MFKETNCGAFQKYFEVLTNPSIYKYQEYQYCSIKSFLENATLDNSNLLGLTSGGRTVNERPEEYLIEYGADCDVQSAYGGQLNK